MLLFPLLLCHMYASTGTGTMELQCSRDNFLRSDKHNVNEGVNIELLISGTGGRRTLVGFDLGTLNIAGVRQVSLVLTIKEATYNFSANGRLVYVHRLDGDVQWLEGNGFNLGSTAENQYRGDGPGSTYQCGVDTDVQNQKYDCSVKWNGGWDAALPNLSQPILLTNGITGDVSWDVTQDFITALNEGRQDISFMVKKENDGATGKAVFYSKEGSAQLGPRLVLEYNDPLFITLNPANDISVTDEQLSITGETQNASNLTINGTNVALGNNLFSHTVTLQPGENILTLIASNSSGAQHQKIIAVTYEDNSDQNPPQITITSPQDGYTGKETVVKVSGTIMDQSTIAYVKVNNSETQLNNGVFSIDLSLSEGENTITVTAADDYDNVAEKSITVTIDSLVPVLTSDLVHGSYLRTGTVTVSGNVSDASDVTFTVNNQPVSLTAGFFETQLELSEGEHTITLKAVDIALNQAIESINVTIDSIPPVISITSPRENSIVNRATTGINGKIDDADPFKITMNSLEGELIGTNFYFNNVSLTEGENRLTFTAEDRAGNTSQKEYIIHLDSTAPAISITGPVPGSLLGTNAVLVSGTVSDEHLNNVKVNGTVCQVENGLFNILLNLLEGVSAIEAVATDTAGNSSSAQVIVTIDTRPATINIDTPKDRALLNISSIDISGTAADIHLASVKVNNQPAVLEDNRFSITGFNLSEGENLLSVQAVDQIGNSTSKSIKVILDTVVPERLTVIPADHTSYVPVGSKIEVEFSEAIDPVSLTNESFYLETEDSQKIPGTFAAAGNKVTFTPGQPLPDSETIKLALTAEVKDLAGNGLVNPYQGDFFTRDLTAPPVPNLDPLPSKTSAGSVTVSGVCEPSALISLWGGLSTATATCDAGGLFSVTLYLKENQLNQVCADARDQAGNKSAPVCVSITRDNSDFVVLDAEFSDNQLKVFFSKPVKVSSLNSASLVVTTGGGVQGGTIETVSNDEEGLFTPTADLTSATVMVEVKTTVLDSEGKALVYPFVKVFNVSGGEFIAQGEVYDDSTGQRLEGVLVQLIDVNGSQPQQPVPSTMTTPEGKYVLLIPAGRCVLRITKEGYSISDRVVPATAGFGSLLLDSRLQKSEYIQQVFVPGGGNGTFGGLIVVYPPGTVETETVVSIDSIGSQAIKARLPYGWSPLEIVDVTIEGATPGNNPLLKTCTLRIANKWTSVTADKLALARWDEESYQWQSVSPVFVTEDNLAGSFDRAGQYAYLIKDSAPIVPGDAVIGQEVPGVQPGQIPQTLTTTFTFDPVEIYPGETSKGSLTFTSQTPISSGVGVQAKIKESYELLSGSSSAFPVYTADMTSYNYGSSESKLEFKVSPDKSISIQDLKIGEINTDMYRFSSESFGFVVGSDGGTVSGEGGAEILIAEASVNGPTAVTLKKLELENISVALPAGFTVLGAVDLSFGGTVLLKPAELSLPLESQTIPAESQLFAVRLQKIEADFTWVLNSPCFVESDRIKTLTDGGAGLPFKGVNSGGIYVFLQAENPVGFITGKVFDRNQPLAGAVVNLADSHDIFDLSAPDGTFLQLSFTGNFDISALNPHSYDVGISTGTVAAKDETVNLDIHILETGPEVVTITPVNNTADVPLNSKIVIIFSEAVKSETFTSANFYVKTGPESIPGQLQLSADGKQGEFIPQEGFPSDGFVQITLTTGIKDLTDTPMAEIFSSTFKTIDATPPEADFSKIKVIIPENGVTRVIGGAGSVEPGTTVTIYNERTQEAKSVTALSDGSFELSIAATLEDNLKITMIDQSNNITELAHKPFESEDGTRVLMDERGGEFINIQGMGIKVEPGTFTGKVNVGIAQITGTDTIAPLPEGMGYESLNAMNVAFSGQTPNKPVTLSFPAPAGVTVDD
ncbi:MAG: hypothetical protein GY940_13630, partial [bacterium]|nr:hypothetical protein [bacterium]